MDEKDIKSSELVEKIAAYNTAISELKKRCDEANINLDIHRIFDDLEIFKIELPAGRKKRTLIFNNAEQINRFLDCRFEDYVFLDGYLAVASYELGSIESLIDPINNSIPRIFTFDRLRKAFSCEEMEEGDDESRVDFSLTTEKKIGGNIVKLSVGSCQLSLLWNGDRRRSGGGISIKIENINIDNHDQALEILENISGSLFFQIDLLVGIPLSLSRERRPYRSKPKVNTPSTIFNFPEQHYEKEPLSLYWYAKSANRMPLLNFLAYYQAIELFFPNYSQIGSKRRVSNILKDPTFDKFKDADVIRLISTMKPGLGGGFGNELSQLKSTINECLSEQNVRDFIESIPELNHFYKSKDWNKISKHKIHVANLGEDLRPLVANRIYDIRCKIVHTKSGENGENLDLLLPFSKEADMLYLDLQLLEFITKQVIISSSGPITIH